MLIQRFNEGDIRAFEVLVTKYQRRVASLINMNVRNSSVAEELTQEVFLRTYRALVNFRFESAFSTWLYMIARNISTSYHRDGHMHADNAVSMDVLAETGHPIDTSRAENYAPSPEDSLCGQQLLFAIEQSIDRLSPQMRNSITMREMEQCSYAQIADALDIPLNTVRSLIFRARATIAHDIRPLLDSAISSG
ncbi:MAG: sigma-70 family RNA polymerase sigma factor [Herminiimonas sp.]|nr:sigma-70 family RNA polymerase sigma factor [Herminiimonas sp.]